MTQPQFQQLFISQINKRMILSHTMHYYKLARKLGLDVRASKLAFAR